MDRQAGPGPAVRRALLAAALFLGSVALSSSAALATEYSAQRLIAPYFAVEAGNPIGLTTLVAIRNDGTETVSVLVTVRGGSPEGLITSFADSLVPNQVLTFNLRDVVPPSAAGPDGLVHGWVVVQSPTPALLSGDFFLVTPDQGFATGFELLPRPRTVAGGPHVS